MGISMIHQELNPVIERSIMENIWLGREPLRGKVGLVDHKKMYSDTVRLLKELELDLDPKRKNEKSHSSTNADGGNSKSGFL